MSYIHESSVFRFPNFLTRCVNNTFACYSLILYTIVAQFVDQLRAHSVGKQNYRYT